MLWQNSEFSIGIAGGYSVRRKLRQRPLSPRFLEWALLKEGTSLLCREERGMHAAFKTTRHHRVYSTENSEEPKKGSSLFSVESLTFCLVAGGVSLEESRSPIYES
jgi:hypothetical protein